MRKQSSFTTNLSPKIVTLKSFENLKVKILMCKTSVNQDLYNGITLMQADPIWPDGIFKKVKVRASHVSLSGVIKEVLRREIQGLKV